MLYTFLLLKIKHWIGITIYFIHPTYCLKKMLTYKKSEIKVCAICCVPIPDFDTACGSYYLLSVVI